MKIETTSGAIVLLQDNGDFIKSIPFGEQEVTPKDKDSLSLGMDGTNDETIYLKGTQIDGETYDNIADMGTVLGSFSISSASLNQGISEQQLNARVPEGGTTGQVLKKQSDGSNAWATDSNTTYSILSESDFNQGTSTAGRLVSAVSLNRDISALLASMTVEDNDLTTDQTSETLNAKYPNRNAGFAVSAPNVNSGMFYRKVSADKWVATVVFSI